MKESIELAEKLGIPIEIGIIPYWELMMNLKPIFDRMCEITENGAKEAEDQKEYSILHEKFKKAILDLAFRHSPISIKIGPRLVVR